MADSFNKKDREKKRRKKQKEKAERKLQRKLDGVKSEEFMYLDADGNLTSTPPDPNAKKEEIKLEDIDVSTPKKAEGDETTFEREGTVKFFNEEKGYGFIIDKLTGDSFFVHADNLMDDIGSYDKVIFEMGSGPKGPIAINVKLHKK